MKLLPVALLSAAALASVATAAWAGTLSGTVKTTGLRNNADAVVYVDAVPGKTWPAPTRHVVVDQKDMEFVPHVLAVQVGTTVDFLNSDALLHNVFSPDKCADRFNLGSWPQGQERSFTFAKPCAATLLCRVHPEMEGYVVAVPTPYFAVTDASGSFRIADVPDGSYTVKVWHPKQAEASQKVTVSGDTTVSFTLHR